MDFRVLGPLEVEHSGEPVRIGSRMQRRLLALLVVHAGRSVPAGQVIDTLWAGEPPPSAPRGLHTYVSRLRRLLGDDAPLVSDEHGYRLRVENGQVDAHRFEQLVAAAREHPADDPAAVAAGLAEALALWRGPAYGEFAEEEFARPEAIRLDDLRLTATEDALAARLATGDDGAIADLEAFTATNPLRERPHAQLMTALGRAGRPSEALEVYQRLRRRLADELGLEPSPALQRIQADLLRQAPDVTPAVATPATRTADPVDTAPTAGNLPQATTSFVGRGNETDTVCRLLAQGQLVTLTGVGGVGKTRLALHAAEQVATDHPDGVWWCELAPTDPDAVGHAVATVLGVQQQANHDVVDSIVGALDRKRLLLVLDNCEHVVAEAARLIAHVLRACPHVTVLATSREPLAVGGEQLWRVPPLALPSEHAEVDDPAPSVRLFLDRAAAHGARSVLEEQPAAVLADICRQLDGVPLAIELAAALVPALEPAEIAERLGHRFGLLTRGPRTDPRHRSLAAVVDWSYQLLEPEEQHLFDRLAVFAGGFTLTAVEHVCADDDVPAEQVAGLLAGLVERSVVGVDDRRGPARYHLLETLRQFAAERLAERGEDAAVRARHTAWFVDLAETADEEVRGPREATAIARLGAEFANLRAAHRWALEHDDADLALRLVVALYAYATWRLRDEVFAWTEEAAELPTATRHRLQPVAWGVLARGLSNRGELVRTRDLAEQALAAVPDVHDPRRFAAADTLAAAALYAGRLEEAREYSRQAHTAVRDEGATYFRVLAPLHEVLALVYGLDQEAGLEAAVALRASAERLGNPDVQAWSLYAHAEACGDADPEQAHQLLEDALVVAEPVDNRFLQGVARLTIATLRARHHSPREALTSFPEVIHHWRRAGDWTHQWTTLRNLVPLLTELGADEPAALLLGAQRRADTAPAFGAEAARLAAAGEALATRLGADAFDALLTRGEGLGGEGAVDVAQRSITDLLASHAEG